MPKLGEGIKKRIQKTVLVLRCLDLGRVKYGCRLPAQPIDPAVDGQGGGGKAGLRCNQLACYRLA